jgi:hypothetical protein
MVVIPNAYNLLFISLSVNSQLLNFRDDRLEVGIAVVLAELTGVGESTMSRRKSFKKSLRESFRRLRSRRSDRRRKTEGPGDDPRLRLVGLRAVNFSCCEQQCYVVVLSAFTKHELLCNPAFRKD